jgi:dTDP-4-dehydrorhamnose 3,5-epimerase
MRISAGELEGVKVLEPQVHGDERGFFVETFRQEVLQDAGIDLAWVQDNHSRSRQGTIRGMHFDAGQSKLVRCARGAIFDAVCDIRLGSPTFGRWEGYQLDDQVHRQLFVPLGFAHGFCVLSELADVVYKTSSYYDPRSEGGFRFDDPAVGIEWPTAGTPTVSARDREAPTLAQIADTLPFRYERR